MKKIVSEDGSKVLYETDNEDEILLKYTDDLVDQKGNVKGTIKNKATINATVATHIYKVLSSYHVPTLFKSQKSAKELLMKKGEIFPLRLVVTCEPPENAGVAPVLKYEHLINGSENQISADEIIASELLSEQQLWDIRRYALKINVVLRNFFERRQLELIEFSVQFGLVSGKISVCSDFTPDTCDLKDVDSRTKFKTSYLISHLDDAAELYKLVHDKIML